MRYQINGREVTREEWLQGAPGVTPGTPPNISGTDSAFNEGWCNGNQFEGQDHIGDVYKKEAKRRGVDITGKRYLSALALYPGDPRAWVNSRGEVEKIVRERGMGCHGAVNIKAADADHAPAESLDVAPDIIERHTQLVEATQGPAANETERNKIRHAVKERLKPAWKRKRQKIKV